MNEIDFLIKNCALHAEHLEKLFRLFKKDVFALALSIVKKIHIANDVVSETFLRLYNSSGKYKPQGRGKVYILKIASNVAREQLRKNRRNIELEDIYTINPFEQADSKLTVEGLLHSLNEKEYQVIILKFYNRLTFAEMSEVLKAPQSTLKSRYETAMGKMRTALKMEETENV